MLQRSATIPQPIKVVMVGEGGVGKTTMAEIFCRNNSNGEAVITTQTIGVQFHSKVADHNGIRNRIQIWDLGGQRRFREMGVFEKYCLGCNGALVCFDLTDLETLVMISRWVEILPPGTPSILVGTKSDKIKDTEGDVQLEDVLPYIKKYRCSGFLRTTARQPESIQHAFLSLLALIRSNLSRNEKEDLRTTQMVDVPIIQR